MLRFRRPVTALTVTGLALTALVAVPAPAHAAPAAPAAPDTIATNAELTRELIRLSLRSGGRIAVRPVGLTNERRPIWYAQVGTGPVRLLYVTEQHGDEPLGTEAALGALATVGASDSSWARRLRSRITLGVIVRANPDGHQRNWRYNYDPDAVPEYGEPGKGYDINRYHNPGLAPADNPVPEAAAIQRTWRSFRPHLMVDYHMQGRYQGPGGREVTTSVMWPTAPGTDPRVVDRSKRICVLFHDVLTRRLDAVVTQYPGGDYEGIARNGYGLRGTPTALVELSALGPALERYQIESAYRTMVALAVAAGTGTLDRIDPARADAIPPRGTPIPAAA
jgi:hypothetical protein